jgi:hypothetical protein
LNDDRTRLNDNFIPFVTALQLAVHMNGIEPGIKDKIIERLILNFGFFDDYPSP